MTTSSLTKKGFPKGLTTKHLLDKDENGVPTIIWVVVNNELENTPKNLLTHRVLSQQDLEGRSAYHLAAKYDQFKHIPKALINLDILKECTDNGQTTWGTLIRNDQFKEVLPFLKDLINERDAGGETFLHVCASAGELQQVSKKYMTKNRIFSTVNRSNENVIDYGAYYGCLDQLPKEFITEEAMNLRNSSNQTPLHMATESGKLHLIPKEFLTQKNLEKEDNWGSVFHKAAICCTFDTFPKEFLTEKNLLRRNKNNGMNPLYILAREYCEASMGDKREKAKKQFTSLIKLLSTKNLQTLKNELGVEDWSPAVSITKSELSKRKLLTRLKQEKSSVDI
jgi:ankyrin repeat protein